MSDYDDETLRVSGDVTPVSTPSPSIDHGRFVPGALVGSRYRVVALLGKGGMGEVYRADDLLLGQPVALKFLPKRIAGNPNALARLLAEVRIARQISHPNVCRVYDVGEVDGEHFISMEYVQGEDLRSLLHRIGRFGADKGIQIARQICAGLAAAHDRGVLHRDLKPANVMIDERGAARITDFGLAVLADSAEAQKREGTPAYMSPEQLEGEEVTTRSDIYSLGLVLYEIFSGRMLFDAKTLTELFELRRNTTTTSIRLTSDIDPLVERVIQRCLADDPQQRPKSATAVSASLPGGDPLAAALEAGETPSPEVVARAGAHEALEPARAFAALGVIVVLLTAVFICKQKVDLISRAGVHDPPEAMAVRARDLLARAGYTENPRDRAGRYRAAWAGYSTIEYWYRESPAPIEPSAFFRHGFVEMPGLINPEEPPLEQPGEVLIDLTPAGRLDSLRVVPPLESSSVGSAAADWNLLLHAAGIDPAELTPATPSRTVVPSDHRAAWTWRHGGSTRRIEAASMNGRPVYFETVAEGRPIRRSGFRTFAFVANLSAAILLVSILAWYNIRRNRGDLPSAVRIGFVITIAMLIAWLFGADHVATIAEVGMIVKALSWSTFSGLLIFAAYLALEPVFRRRWPRSLVTWARVLSGRWRDPLVGRDVLAGSIGGLLSVAGLVVVPVIVAWVQGGEPAIRTSNAVWVLNGTRHVIAELLCASPRYFAESFIPVALLILFKIVLRREWLAALGYIGVQFAILLGSAPDRSSMAISILLNATIVLVLLHRFGFLALLVSNTVQALLSFAPVLLPAASWHTGIAASIGALVLAIALFGFITSLGGRRLFTADFLET